MRIKVKAYSVFTEKVGERVVEVDNGLTVRDLVEILLGGLEYRGVSPLVFVNKEKSDLNRILKDGDEVILAPPFSGG